MSIQPLQSRRDKEFPLQICQTALSPWTLPVLPTPATVSKARHSLINTLPTTGLGFSETKRHLVDDIIPGFNGSSLSANYYAFVTGGVTPAALLADTIVSAYDQNVHVHIPDHSVATDVEHRALTLLLDLFDLDRKVWVHKTLTTGATGSNVLGLALGREFVLRAAVERKVGADRAAIKSVGEHGMAEVLLAAGLKGLQVLSTYPHSSIGKAAGVLGIGRANVKSICASGGSESQHPLRFDFEILEKELSRSDVASIVAVSCGEVNTGHFATGGLEEFREIRHLCDKYGAWLHVDGAFGMFGRILKSGKEFDRILKGCQGLELADSITGDAHKLLNVPYDCGIFFSRHADIAEDVCRNPNAVYLSVGAGEIPAPCNIGLENSRRLRALPVYATLVAYGKDGYRDMLERQIKLARSVAGWLLEHPAYEVLPHNPVKESLLQDTFIIVLFRAIDEGLNKVLVNKINANSIIFVSGTSWDGKPACRIAISNWRVIEEKDFEMITTVLREIAQ
ncbi:L-2,4-diaminobutyrate decarboxylase [Histoplasma capsulatum G186AR]|uniref:L-2,4-diaminobutyrate decarboxylase n=2 Tax=Ajellomyces capsulatus TaxID=5037 RepID=C0NCT0_AJECG|nr:L-2,4-diaminobutyrate decarboxylase [Histoplasma capsulatum G186AR]EEH11471.1 L-2,4-diaminobutyrate decarboxylase [Histoplasma capsulatum G186AR]KAG5302685.1 L-2,4-diaminobutyrate decarboxylase [Histoplasma capsulatum]QSS71914.1 L-2,4-diaminobutyrate decarboxylase [Histoplasma capsulatum G186AR]